MFKPFPTWIPGTLIFTYPATEIFLNEISMCRQKNNKKQVSQSWETNSNYQLRLTSNRLVSYNWFHNGRCDQLAVELMKSFDMQLKNINPEKALSVKNNHFVKKFWVGILKAALHSNNVWIKPLRHQNKVCVTLLPSELLSSIIVDCELYDLNMFSVVVVNCTTSIL